MTPANTQLFLVLIKLGDKTHGITIEAVNLEQAENMVTFAGMTVEPVVKEIEQ